jgi:hypothetical protein
MRLLRGGIGPAVVLAAAVAIGGLLPTPAVAQQAQDFNGLWWNSYNAFQPSPDVAPGFWWDHYQPPARPFWNGPYYTVDHWDPYIPRPVVWSPLIYSFANFPPQSTRPAGFYAQFSPGPITYPENATVFWQYIWPTLTPETRSLIAGQLGLGAGLGASVPVPGGTAADEAPIPALPPVRPKEYYRKAVAGPLRGTYWQERQVPLHELPGPRIIRGDHLGFTQYYRPPGESRWVFRPTRTPKNVIEPGKERKAEAPKAK